MTRAEMRRAAQAAGRRAGRRKAGAGRQHAGVRDGRSAPPGAKRFINYPRADRRGLWRWIPSWRQLLGIFVMSFGTLTAGVGYAYATTQIPDINPSTQLQDNIFYWSDGSVMASVGQVNRQNVQLADVPAKVQWDFLAAENASFYTDPGIDPQGILRAVYHMASGGAVQSGSTITQQFVKNSYLNQSQTVTRKLSEIMISLKIGTKMSKQEILQGYLNSNYYGRGAYGIEAAAESYYHVPVKDLNVSQGAFLAATVNEPSVLMNADSDPQAKQEASARWRYVLDRMVVIHQISAAQEQQYIAAGFPTPVATSTNGAMTGQVGYLVKTAGDYVKTHLNINDQQFNNGGYQIHTTFDKNKVNELAASVDKMTKQHLDPKHRSADRNVQAGAASVDPTSGRIVALYGGPGFDKQHFTNNADTKGVPVGSTFKPFDLAAALDHGAVLSPASRPHRSRRRASSTATTASRSRTSRATTYRTATTRPASCTSRTTPRPSGVTSVSARPWSNRSTPRTCSLASTSATATSRTRLSTRVCSGAACSTTPLASTSAPPPRPRSGWPTPTARSRTAGSTTSRTR